MDFGVLALLPIVFFPFALLTGVISIVVILFSHRSLVSLVYSFLAIILSLPVVYIGTEFFLSPNVREENKKKHTALYNMELLAKELKKYAQNHDGHLPDADNWCDALMNENTNLTVENFRFPEPELLNLKGKCHIAFNRELSGKRLSEVSPATILLFEADGEWNLNGTESLLKTRSELYIDMLYMDGSIYSYWFDRGAVRKYKNKFGKAYMYYEEPRWNP
jgi:hypothetical protein